MKGKYRIQLETVNCNYDLTIERNITIIKGDGARGKTVLTETVQQYLNELSVDDTVPTVSGISLKINNKIVKRDSDISIIVYSNELENLIDTLHNKIIIIDEMDMKYSFKHIEDIVQFKDCYFILITRRKLGSLSYSMKEIYYMESNHELHPTNIIKRMYIQNSNKIHIDYLFTEDSNSGFKFFHDILDKDTVFSLKSKSNCFLFILNYLGLRYDAIFENLKFDKSKILGILIDSASFGCHYEELYECDYNSNNHICLIPSESFEWLILNSAELYDNKDLQQVLKATYDYCGSSEYSSYEDFYSKNINTFISGIKYLNNYTATFIPIKYTKKNKPNDIFYSKLSIDSIIKVMSVDISKILKDNYFKEINRDNYKKDFKISNNSLHESDLKVSDNDDFCIQTSLF